MKILRGDRFITAILIAVATAGPTASQNFNGTGNWSCSVTLFEQGLQPYGYQANISARSDGGLVAQGAVYDPNLARSVVPFQAGGDWMVYSNADGITLRLRVHTQSHGILVFEGYATSANTTYLRTGIGRGGQAESQCTRIG